MTDVETSKRMAMCAGCDHVHDMDDRIDKGDCMGCPECGESGILIWEAGDG